MSMSHCLEENNRIWNICKLNGIFKIILIKIWSAEITAVRIPGLMSSVEQGAGGLRDEDPGGHLRRGEQDQVLRLMELEVRRGPRRHWKLYW